ncbi:MAG: peptide deformylase [Proteobacteria bacterium]|nr:peptide deformylase [Pseudomonadota bacterium]MDA1356324.1 peptide deformylase [Pseudomonadota bacterium]
MAILKIARMGHPLLMRIADPIADPRAPAIGQLISDMIDTLADAAGAGLAAPQVHVPLRLVMFHVPAARAREEDGEAAEGCPFTVLINPEIEAVSDNMGVGTADGMDDDMVDGLEACLSLPGLAGIVPRHHHIRYRGLTHRGETIEREARGFHARVVQHECDHLDGVLYPMRMRDLSTLSFTSELSRAETEEDQEDSEL